VQTLTASYGVRAGTGVLASDAVFTRQFTDASYTVKHGHQTVKVSFLGGRIAGAPPMFERFLLGNAETLRGWNKFDLNPAGATRAVHGSVDYIWRHFLLFYDTGSAWNYGEDPEQRQSLGIGLNGGGFEFGVGFPIRTGKANPVVYVGMKF
jgi:outer membrane protein assembly factor BamA